MANKRFEEGFLIGMQLGGGGKTIVDPTIWNTAGIYTYFFIDFTVDVADFSLGMFAESIAISTSAGYLTPSIVEKVSSKIYKVWIDISTANSGVTVTNKVNSLINTTGGTSLEVFSKSFYPEGLAISIRLKYLFERFQLPPTISNLSEAVSSEFWNSDDNGSISESIQYPVILQSQLAEVVTIVLT